MKIISTAIPDVKILEPKVFGDDRGFFMETWNVELFSSLGINANFVQDNHSRSVKNTLRGLHYQIKQPQGKLVRVTRGEVFDVAVDLRKSSPTFGQWVGEYLSEENRRMMWVPPGFAHGFLVTSDVADFQYKCTDFYAPEYERTIRWDDADLNIQWGPEKTDDLLLSKKDEQGKWFAQARAEIEGYA
ncbi:dTDP-4-dehydrorhamnose 3,5-epimerase [Marinobacter sp. M3C]|jgi:dTDP-4-dehydrorhamnose 3,5-epimerase|uniref:dTDP-4-dehydrorhamnose 3,5-epimerase n=1 Tax=unclassified Marinobacter TaxID=83889 RepID=UPI00200C6DE9|nr:MULTISPECIES: dTDP-4-dehydrorhamnose 3,5-epimerase [unclassified Marinobacter]MCL1479072.1 dTDP-4-dehydrorhamnose 3,5-epimerase [Marinobacter sp.]MCL1485127.1 dTDP-4-dehydrorhamnose 3,5-epimerase [Marinobacter sp.]MCL1488958.1 dTDP-4-dehydrorhamnose 3,5-epimerase [Marinobacter sp.]UQG57150.1 dTDP-4-dehydrorhamnose 3,5-epimerase [Marinobacter sp. M4C]UQG61668.1 dTDP-4-dehydrorhamnose 3,5-epimerase [Marinobacter sp. M3C]